MIIKAKPPIDKTLPVDVIAQQIAKRMNYDSDPCECCGVTPHYRVRYVGDDDSGRHIFLYDGRMYPHRPEWAFIYADDECVRPLPTKFLDMRGCANSDEEAEFLHCEPYTTFQKWVADWDAFCAKKEAAESTASNASHGATPEDRRATATSGDKEP
jgi:hypothetical protein